jgi:hypothetical protein
VLAQHRGRADDLFGFAPPTCSSVILESVTAQERSKFQRLIIRRNQFGVALVCCVAPAAAARPGFETEALGN